MKNELAALAVCATLIGGTVSAVTYFAKADDLKKVSVRLEQKIIGDRIWSVQERLWQLEDRYQDKDCATWDERDREEYRQLMLESKELKRQTDEEANP